MELRGEARTLPDGSLELTMRPVPAKGPEVEMLSKNNCGPMPFSVPQKVPFPAWSMGGPYKLVKGVFRHVVEDPRSIPRGVGVTGKAWLEVTLE